MASKNWNWYLYKKKCIQVARSSDWNSILSLYYLGLNSTDVDDVWIWPARWNWSLQQSLRSLEPRDWWADVPSSLLTKGTEGKNNEINYLTFSQMKSNIIFFLYIKTYRCIVRKKSINHKFDHNEKLPINKTINVDLHKETEFIYFVYWDCTVTFSPVGYIYDKKL